MVRINESANTCAEGVSEDGCIAWLTSREPGKQVHTGEAGPTVHLETGDLEHALTR